MGQQGAAAAAVRRLCAPGDVPAAAPPPLLHAVEPDERPPVEQAEFRQVLGHFASGVTVVTAPGEGGTGPAGFACQSFSSLSLAPPLVTFLVGRSSTTWPRIGRTGVFCVNVLAAGQEALCRAFAVSGADKFAGVAWDPAPVTGSPRLRGCLAWIDCTIHAVHTGGDHLIVIGRVGDLGADPTAEPLLFYRGAFAAMKRSHRD